MAYVLIFYAWTFSSHAGGGVGMAEFSSLERCETAAALAKKEFDGVYSKMYHVCAQK